MSFISSVQTPEPIELAMTEIICDYPFHASILLKHPIVADTTIATACISARGNMRYNPKWFALMTVKQIVFVLCHECMHYMYMHCTRRMWRDKRKFNIACDGVINETLIACCIGNMPENGVRFAGAENMSAEQVYDLMFPPQSDQPQGDPPPQPPKGADGDPCEDGDPTSGGDTPDDEQDGDDTGGSTAGDDQDGEQDGDGSGSGDDNTDELPDWGIGEDLDESEPMDESTEAEIAAEVRVEINQAVNAAKQMGKLPALLKRFADELLEVRTPWYDKLYHFFTGIAEDDFSYPALDRRFISSGIYLPWFTGNGLKSIVLVIDVSGSVSSIELKHFSQHVNTVLDTCKPEVLYVVYCHTHVCKVDEITPDDYPVELSCDESGGTNMTRGIDWVVDNQPDTDAIIVLTDGYTPFGSDPQIPTFWAITTNVTPPWGEHVQLNVTD